MGRVKSRAMSIYPSGSTPIAKSIEEAGRKLGNSSQKTYRYYVHDYAGNPAITNSEAKVEIYSQTGLIKSYNVPVSGTGKFWEVFSYSASTGKITTIDKITSVKPN